jgi:hypothetical protein
MLEKNANRQLIEEGFETVLNQKLRVQFVVTQGPVTPQAAPKTAKTAPAASVPPPVSEGEASKMTDILSQTLNIFEGSKVIKVE